MRIYHHNGNPPKHIEAALQAKQHSDAILQAIKGRISLKDVKDDPTSRRFAVSKIDQSRMPFVNYSTPHQGMKFPNLQGTSIDPTNVQALLARGSTPNTVNGTLSYTSTTTTITWTWTGLSILRADGSTTAIPNGNITFSSLTANTKYYFYPYWSEANQNVNWAGGANLAVNFTAAQTMYLQYNVPLSAGSIATTTPASGSGGGTGGGGGNVGGGCLHPSQKVWTREGELEAAQIEEGMELMTEDGWVPILLAETQAHREWRRMSFGDGRQAWVTPSQPFYSDPGKAVQADMLDAGDSVMAQYGKRVSVKSNSRFYEDSYKVILGIQAPHLFYLWESGPLVHNQISKP